VAGRGQVNKKIPEDVLLKMIKAFQEGKTAKQVMLMFPNHLKHYNSAYRLKTRYSTDPIADAVVEEIITGEKKDVKRNQLEQKRYQKATQQIVAYVDKTNLQTLLQRPRELINIFAGVEHAYTKLLEIEEKHANVPNQDEILERLTEIRDAIKSGTWTKNEREKFFWLNKLQATTEHICDDIKRDTLRINAINSFGKFLELIAKLKIAEEYVVEFHKYMNAIFYGYIIAEDSLYQAMKQRVLDKEPSMEKFFNEYEIVEGKE